MVSKCYYRVLSIAGSDSGGGAGIQADIKTISACGCYAMTAITAVTVQNTVGVTDVHSIPTSIISAQIHSVLDDIGADAVKIGMLHSHEVISTVAEALCSYPIRNIVLDPIMISTSGRPLMQPNAVETLRGTLLGKARIITPNIPEAEVLLGRSLTTYNDLKKGARDLSMNGKISVFLKAGHFVGTELTDIVYNAETGETLELPSHKIATNNTHGTGCTLSSALAAFLARGYSLHEAVFAAKQYIASAIVAGAEYLIGNGHGPVHHFFEFWQ